MQAKHNKRIWKKRFALLICISLLLSVIPTSASAKDTSSSETSVAVGAEVVSLREENIKHYDMGNGTYQAIAYSHPIHEMDSEGNWQDIDFGMTLTQTRGIGTYKNGSGTSFRQNYAAGQPIMTLSGDNTAIAMTLVANTGTQVARVQAVPVTATVTESQTNLGTFAAAQAATFSNTLFYENVLPGVDLEYIVDPWTVKENIVVKQPAAQYAYTFKLDLEGLYPVLQADGSVLIYNAETAEAAYEIPAPYMYDAAGELSFNVNYTLSGENGVYYFTVTADSGWVNAPKRAFPITIDPSYVITNSAIQDTYINSDSPGEVKGSNTFFYSGDTEVGYIKVPTPGIPTNAILKWATLDIYYFYWNNIKSGHVDVTAHRVNNLDWDEDSLTWNSVQASGVSNFGLSTEILNNTPENNYGVNRCSAGSAYPTSPEPVSILITDAVKSWRTIPNNGIGLKRKADSSTNLSVAFRSTEGPADHRPTVTYRYDSESEQQYLLRNFYDSTMSDNMEDISAAISTACSAFRNQFGILLLSNTPIDRSELTDNTVHKDLYAISNTLLDDIEYSNEIIAFWTDYDLGTFCDHSESSDECRPDNTSFAKRFLGRPVLQIMNVPFEDEYEASLSILLMHEIAHTFGLGEKYNGGNHDVAGEWICVMEAFEPYSKQAEYKLKTFYDDIKSGENAFCEDCESELRNAIANGLGD